MLGYLLEDRAAGKLLGRDTWKTSEASCLMLVLSFITRALWRAWQTEHVLWGLHQPLACCLMQFSQMYQSGRQDPAIWTAFIASWANSQEMFNNVPRTSVARSRFLEWRVAKRNPGSALFQLLVTCWFCCYCLRACLFLKKVVSVWGFQRPNSRWFQYAHLVADQCVQQNPWPVHAQRGSGPHARWRAAVSSQQPEQCWADLQQPRMLVMQRHQCWGNQRANTIKDREFSGDLGYISRLQHGIQPGTLTGSAMEFKRGSVERSLSIANCLILK